MLKTVAKDATTTTEDPLKAKSRDASVISGGHPVAKALKAEGVDTIFRIIDVRHQHTAALVL